MWNMSKSDIVSSMFDNIENKVREFKGDFLIGMIKLSEESYGEVINLAGSLINKDKYLLKSYKNAIISIALVNYAIKDYQNGQFWHEVAVKLKCDVHEVMKVGKQAFEDFCIDKSLYFHVGHKNKGYVTSILTHAIIPNSSLTKFIEFLQDLYFKDLEEDYIDQEVEELIQYMHRLFTKYLEDEDISLVVQGSKMTIARQHLPKSFRIAFVKAPSIVSPIIERLLFYINQRNYGERIEYFEHDRFDQYFSEYEYLNKSLTLDMVKKTRRAGNLKKFHIAQYYYDKNDLYLQLPRQIIESEYVENELYAEVLFDDLVIIEENLSLTKSRILFKTEQKSIRLSQFDSKISYRIKSGNSIIYDSKSSLFREFIIFDFEGNEVSPRKLTDDPIKIITCLNNEILTDDAEIIIEKHEKYKITTVYLNDESVLIINDKIISTSVAAVRNELDSKVRYNGICVRDFYKEYQVYSEVPSITLRIPYEKNISDFIITVNAHKQMLINVSSAETKSICDGSGDRLAKVIFSEGYILEKNPSEIIIREKGSNRIYIEENIFIIKSLKYKFDKNYYYRDKEAFITELDSNEIRFINTYELPIKVNIKKSINFTAEFEYNKSRYFLIIELPMLSWKLGNINSEMKASENIWWRNIKDYKLYIKFPDKVSKLHIIESNNYEKLQGKRNGEEYKYSLDYLFHVTNKKAITLGVRLGEKDVLISVIHFKPSIKDFYISYNNDHMITGLLAGWNFLGANKLFVDIIYSKNSQILKHYEFEEYEHLMDNDIELYYGAHDIEIYQIEEDDFFGGPAIKNILLHERFIVGDPMLVKFKNRIIKVKKCTSDSTKFYLDNFYLKDFKFAKRRGYYEATGFYYIRDCHTGEEREWFFTKYNPFILKPIDVETDKLTFEIVDRDGDGLIYDAKTTHVNPREENGNGSRYKLIDTIVLELLK